MGPPPLKMATTVSTSVEDRDGRLLRAFTTKHGRWRLPITQAQTDQRYLALLFAFEDKRFWHHAGIDPLALARAAMQYAANGRAVSGASTITMQVARLLEQRHDRTLIGKFRQMLRALQIEARLTKHQILDLYLRLAPFGGNIEGVRAASLTYFAKEPRRLSLGEAALLVALPQSPEARRPDRYPARAKAARNRVLDRSYRTGLITHAELARAKLEPVPTRRHAFPLFAAHLAEAEVRRFPKKVIHRLTINRRIQNNLEQLTAQHVQSWGAQVSAAIVAVDHTTGEILAHVGSPNYFDTKRFGAIDMVNALRSPGSTLKPLIYGMSFDLGLAHPETLIEDRPTNFGTYRPKNFDNEFSGTVTVRDALTRSLNIPAVKALDGIGPGRLYARLRKAGINVALPPETEPSLAIALGGIGISLREAASLFAAIARGGEVIPLSHHRRAKENVPVLNNRRSSPLLSETSTAYLTDILKGAPPPRNARAGQIAFKTGTSYGHRDAWAIGYDGAHTIAVWIGRPDMVSTPGLMGRTAAAPILFDAFARLTHRRTRFRRPPNSMIQVASGADLPPPLKRFERNRTGAVHAPSIGPFKVRPIAIVFPHDRSKFDVAASSLIQVKAVGGQLPLTWLVDGIPIGTSRIRRTLLWRPDLIGFSRLSVVDANGKVDRVVVRLMAE